VAGEAFMNAGDPSAALHEFELRIKSSRDDAKALYRLGELEERAGRLKPAREWYQHALRQGPELVAPRLHLAFIHERADGNFPAAERHVREILTRYRRFASSREIFLAQVELIRILSRSERAPEALELLGHFPADFTTAPLALLTKAELYAASGRTQDATAAYRDFSGPAALNAYARVQLGLLLSSKGEIDDAVRAFRDAIGLEPRDLPAYLHAVRVLTDAKRPTEALEVANIAVSRGQMLNMRDHYEPFEETRDPLPWKSLSGVCERLAKTQKEQYSAYAFLGLCRLQEGIDTRDDAAIKKGLQALTRARQLNEGHEFVRLYFGRAHLMLGNHAKAREAFEESLRLNPLNPAARYGLAESYAATRQAGKAQAELARIIADPDWGARALNLSGEILARQKRGAEARDHWKAALKADPFFLPPWKSLLAAKAPR
jgi:tetratricopeptide (TPR) repeat protein